MSQKRDKWVIGIKDENARLREINAELLEALKFIRDQDVNCTQEEDSKAWEYVNAVIAKAEGKS